MKVFNILNGKKDFMIKLISALIILIFSSYFLISCSNSDKAKSSESKSDKKVEQLKEDNKDNKKSDADIQDSEVAPAENPSPISSVPKKLVQNDTYNYYDNYYDNYNYDNYYDDMDDDFDNYYDEYDDGYEYDDEEYDY